MDHKVYVPILILYGMDDNVVGPEFVHLCEVAFTNRTGPVVLPGAGHFLQCERADLFNALVIAFFGDLRVRHELPVWTALSALGEYAGGHP